PVVPEPAPNETPPAAPPAPSGVAPPSSEPSANKACVPDCRSGFPCPAGECVSACNPPCPGGEECEASGRCAARDQSALKQTIKEAVKEYYEERRAEYRAQTIRHHDGFYLRLGLNAGYARDSAQRGEAKTTSRGFGLFLDDAFG